TEPQFVAARNGASPAFAPAPAAADARTASFEVAKQASAQRAVGSVASLDSISATARLKDARNDKSTRIVNGQTFELRDSVWTDVRFGKTAVTTKIKPFSKAYFDILERLPELRAVFALGDRVVAVGRSGAISLSTDGVADLTAASLDSFVARW